MPQDQLTTFPQGIVESSDPSLTVGEKHIIGLTTTRRLKAESTISGTVPLPTGASTAAKQDTGNTSLASIDGKDFATQTTLALIKAKTDNIPAQGQALAAASTPVVLPATQITTLTPPAAITGFALETTLTSIKDTAGIKKITDQLPAG